MEKLDVLLVKPHVRPERVQIDAGLRSLQEMVGGLIQAVFPYDDPVALIMNEEGKLLGLEPNRLLRDDEGNVYDIIVGDFLIVGLTEGDFGSLSPELMRKYEKLFRWTEWILPNGEEILMLSDEE